MFRYCISLQTRLLTSRTTCPLSRVFSIIINCTCRIACICTAQKSLSLPRSLRNRFLAAIARTSLMPGRAILSVWTDLPNTWCSGLTLSTECRTKAFIFLYLCQYFNFTFQLFLYQLDSSTYSNYHPTKSISYLKKLTYTKIHEFSLNKCKMTLKLTSGSPETVFLNLQFACRSVSRNHWNYCLNLSKLDSNR